MKKIILTTAIALLALVSCIDPDLISMGNCNYRYNENIVVSGNTCYVYYSNPTASFLNTLRIINGSYHYFYNGRYIPVIFPRWRMWKPERYYYYNRDRWIPIERSNRFPKPRFNKPDFGRNPPVFNRNRKPQINFGEQNRQNPMNNGHHFGGGHR